MLLLPASASMYLEALSRYMELILLSLLEKDIFELDLEGCFENHNCQIWSKKFSTLCFSSLIILLNLSESMEVEAEADTEAYIRGQVCEQQCRWVCRLTSVPM